MANPSYMGLAGSLARARKPPAQNDVYLHNTPGSGRPPQQFGGGPRPFKQDYGLGAAGFRNTMQPPMGGGRGIGMMPPQGGGSSAQDFFGGIAAAGAGAQPVSYGGGMPGGNPGDMGGLLGNPGGGPSFGGGPAPFPSYDPLKNEKPMGGGVAMLGPPTPMQVPGFGGGPTMAKPLGMPGGDPMQSPLEDYQRRAPGRRFP